MTESAPESIPDRLPLLPVRDIVLFPSMRLPLAVGRDKSRRAVEAALARHQMIFLVAQKQVQTEDPQAEDIFKIGTIASILEPVKMPDGSFKILVEGLARGRVRSFRVRNEEHYVEVEVDALSEEVAMSSETRALIRQAVGLFEQYLKLDDQGGKPERQLSFDAMRANGEPGPSQLADTIASHMLIGLAEKQSLLEVIDPRERLERIVGMLGAEIEIAKIRRRIDSQVREQFDRTQREYVLNEQMKAIQRELRQKDDGSKELDDLREKIKQAQMTAEATEAAEREVSRLEKMMPFSPEATVIRTYLDTLISLPWAAVTEDHLDLKRAQTILDEDHYGLEKPKERITEYLAVLKLVKKIRGPILCFVGPPGVGKTSLARSISRALGRNFVKMSLGGVRDESEIRGHRRTYIGSMPGRIIQSMRKAKSKNPVFLLDEIDKMGIDWRGDPAAALLEVLDPEQNSLFVDHFIDVEFDLSQVLFICTANSLFSIPPSLQDRLEIIRFAGYTEREKLQIAREYLIPKQMKDHGMTAKDLHIADDAVRSVIRQYTREAGVRSLERWIAGLCRKAAKILVGEDVAKPFKITDKNVLKLLGVPEFSRERASENSVGVSTGLAWTEHGGEILAIEVAKMEGKGKLMLTGKLGEVMQESAQAALSFIRSNAKRLNIKETLFKGQDYHIHVPEGATPKDGPSAGTAIATALVSAMTGRAVKKRIAMTGEITLQGRVLPIGGLKEKTLAAYREGMRLVLFPDGNRKDLQEIPEDIRKNLEMIPVKHMDDILSMVLERKH